jgi:hypothetical protein
LNSPVRVLLDGKWNEGAGDPSEHRWREFADRHPYILTQRPWTVCNTIGDTRHDVFC